MSNGYEPKWKWEIQRAPSREPWVCQLSYQKAPSLRPAVVNLFVQIVEVGRAEFEWEWSVWVKDHKYRKSVFKGRTVDVCSAVQAAEALGEAKLDALLNKLPAP